MLLDFKKYCWFINDILNTYKCNNVVDNNTVMTIVLITITMRTVNKMVLEEAIV